MKLSVLLIFVAISCLDSCASLKIQRALDMNVINKIDLNITSEQLMRELGVPNEKRDISEDKQYVWFIYLRQEGAIGDRAIFEFSKDTDILVSKWWFPQEGEAEYDLKFWLAKMSEKREKVIPCGHHWGEIDYLEQGRGIVVQAREQTSYVTAIGWLNSERLDGYRDRLIKSCSHGPN